MNSTGGQPTTWRRRCSMPARPDGSRSTSGSRRPACSTRPRSAGSSTNTPVVWRTARSRISGSTPHPRRQRRDDWTSPSDVGEGEPIAGCHRHRRGAGGAVPRGAALSRARKRLSSLSAQPVDASRPSAGSPSQPSTPSAGHPINETDYSGRNVLRRDRFRRRGRLQRRRALFQCPHNPAAIDVVLRATLPEVALREGRNACCIGSGRASSC